MLRSALMIGALLLGSGAAIAAPDQTIPLGPGSYIYWTSAYEGGSDRYQEQLIAQLDDVQLFKTMNEYSEGDESDYFVLFSGIYFTLCDTEMPTMDERIALSNLWPLTPGAVVEIKSGDGAKIEVGEPTQYFLMGRTHPAHAVSGTYYGDEESSEILTVLDDVKITVGIHWDEGSKDSAMLVTKPNAVASTEVDTDLIGTCADLWNTETE
ncbi:MAG: hypothetical protein AAFZ74_11245 [Pseudomonadota bacterium]